MYRKCRHLLPGHLPRHLEPLHEGGSQQTQEGGAGGRPGGKISQEAQVFRGGCEEEAGGAGGGSGADLQSKPNQEEEKEKEQFC